MPTRRRNRQTDAPHRSGGESGQGASNPPPPVRKTPSSKGSSARRFVVHGAPQPQPRPRAYRRGGLIGIYNPDTADGWKVRVAVAAKDALDRPMQGPLKVALWFKMPRPASHVNKKGAPRSTAPAWHAQRPDTDNLAKAALDAMNLIAFHDDAQIVELIVGKEWAASPSEAGCVISIEALRAI